MDKHLRQRMESIGIDVQRSQQILDNLNAGRYDNVTPLEATGLPEIDGTTIIDRRGDTGYSLPDKHYRDHLGSLAPEVPLELFGTEESGERRLTHADLERIGTLLYPYLAYGVLNGGSATSYADRRKNESYSQELFELYRDDFESLAEICKGQPKGITPAFINPDGSHGASFLELKFRMVLLAGQRYRRLAEELGVAQPHDADGRPLEPGLPFTEMTSQFTHAALQDAYEGYRDSIFLRDLPGHTQALQTACAQQPLLAAMTHSREGRPRDFFQHAWGEGGRPLGIPGGHGQNFQVMADTYRELHRRGKRFLYMGNVDNIGFTIDPVSLAILALSGRQAGFDFAFRTPVDVKGGILVYDQHGTLTCGDIGPAISTEAVLEAEKQGKRILFNCASGLFALADLVGRLETLVDGLPMRISDQEKDAGAYSQAEQVTWEVIGILPEPMIFGINKYRRFLAAKMLLETLLTSGRHAERAAEVQSTVTRLADGLHTVLREEYGLEERDGRWLPQR